MAAARTSEVGVLDVDATVTGAAALLATTVDVLQVGVSPPAATDDDNDDDDDGGDDVLEQAAAAAASSALRCLCAARMLSMRATIA